MLKKLFEGFLGEKKGGGCGYGWGGGCDVTTVRSPVRLVLNVFFERISFWGVCPLVMVCGPG